MKSVLCFGDSNTFGATAIDADGLSTRYERSHRWPYVLSDLLGPEWEVIPEGLPGRTTAYDDPLEGAIRNGYIGLDIALETHKPLDFVVLMLGTNDLKVRLSLTPTDIMKGVERLVTLIKSKPAFAGKPAPQIIIVSPVPILEGRTIRDILDGGEAKSRALAPLYAALAARVGAQFIDAAEHAQVDDLDGVHLTPESHVALAKTIAAKLVPA